MKKTIAIAILLLAGIAVHAALFRVNVTRVDQDLYKTLDGAFIQTMYCYQYVYSEDAIYDEQGGIQGRLIFQNGSCDVRRVFR